MVLLLKSNTNTPVIVTSERWNNEVFEVAYCDLPYKPERAYPAYAASKRLAEKEV